MKACLVFDTTDDEMILSLTTEEIILFSTLRTIVIDGVTHRCHQNGSSYDFDKKEALFMCEF